MLVDRAGLMVIVGLFGCLLDYDMARAYWRLMELVVVGDVFGAFEEL